MIKRSDWWKICLIVAMPAVLFGGVFVCLGLIEVYENGIPVLRQLGATTALAGGIIFGAGLVSCSIVAAGSVRGFDDR